MLTRQVLFMIFAFIVSFAFTFATTPLVRRFAFKIGAIDIPKDNRRMHKKPTPRIGGLAIIFGFTVATLCFAQPSRQLYGTLAGAAIIAVMGVIDDCKNRNSDYCCTCGCVCRRYKNRCVHKPKFPKRQSVLGTSRMAFGNAYCYMDCIHNKCGKLYRRS